MTTLHIHARPTDRLLRACALFGLALAASPRPPRPFAPCHARRAALLIHRSLRPGGIALVRGPSGAGKSTILRALVRHLRGRALPVITPRPWRVEPRSVIDAIPGPLSCALASLSRAGLADATILPLAPSELSDGERHRLALARIIARASRPASRGPTIVLDEFLSVLDRPAAWSIARAAARWVRAEGRVRLVVATAHDDLADALAPDLEIRTVLGAEPVVTVRQHGSDAPGRA